MSHVNVADGIIPMSEFRAKMAELIERTRVNREPLVLTQRGKSVAVVISPREYELLTEHQHFVAAVKAGIEQADRGELVDFDKSMEEIKSSISARAESEKAS